MCGGNDNDNNDNDSDAYVLVQCFHTFESKLVLKDFLFDMIVASQRRNKSPPQLVSSRPRSMSAAALAMWLSSESKLDCCSSAAVASRRVRAGGQRVCRWIDRDEQNG